MPFKEKHGAETNKEEQEKDKKKNKNEEHAKGKHRKKQNAENQRKPEKGGLRSGQRQEQRSIEKKMQGIQCLVTAIIQVKHYIIL